MIIASPVLRTGRTSKRLTSPSGTVRNWFALAAKGDKSAGRFIADLLRLYLSAGAAGGDSNVPANSPAGGEGLSDQDIIDAWERDLMERRARIDGGEDE